MLHQTLDFLTNVFGEDEIEDGYFAIMTLPPGGGKPDHKWFNDVTRAAAYASDCDDLNTYFSMGLFPANAGRRMENVRGMACFGIDVDIKGEAHKRDNLCDSQEGAIELLNTAIPGCLPTIIINSGHGVQGFFVFKEPLMFEDMDDRRAAYATAAALHRTFAIQAGKKGWHIDSTFDLSRVMRLPGTFNNKLAQERRMVLVLESSGQKYADLNDLDQFLVATQDDWEAVHKAFRPVMPTFTPKYDLVLQPDACAPPERLEELLQAESRLMAIWHRKRKPGRPKTDPQEEDHSFSVADMVLANKMVEYGWLNQEIANAIIEHRRKWQEKPGDFAKALRADYIERTISKARERYQEIKEDKDISKARSKVAKKIDKARAQGKKVDDDHKLREQAREVLRDAFGFEISRVIKFCGDQPEYFLETPLHGDIKVGTSGVLTNQQRLKNVLFDSVGTVFKTMKARDFDSVAKALLALIVERGETDTETRDREILKQRIQDYWSANIHSEDRNEGYIRKAPFTDNGRAYIFGTQFRRWMQTEENEKLTAKMMGMQMIQAGCSSEKMLFTTVDSRGRLRWNTSVYDVTPVVGTFEVEDDGETKE